MARRQKFIIRQIYHVYNRGARKSKIFFDSADYERWGELLFWCLSYNYPYSKYRMRLEQVRLGGGNVQEMVDELDRTHRLPVSPVEILAYVYLPNHFHLVLRQITDSGIPIFMHRIGTAYAKYVNERHELSGALYQGPFKAVAVETEGQLKQLFRYVHINVVAAGLVLKEEVLGYEWSSFSSYMSGEENRLLTKESLLGYFPDPQKLYEFTLASFETKEIARLEGLTLDDDLGWYREKEAWRKDRRREQLMRSV